jgi:hypothetical protein
MHTELQFHPLARVRHHRIDITKTSNSRYAVSYDGETIGEWRVPECSAARWLLEQGLAAEGDKLTSYRDGLPCLMGSVGWFAAHTVIENEKAGPVWRKWTPIQAERPFAESGVGLGRPFSNISTTTSPKSGGACIIEPVATRLDLRIPPGRATWRP